jgi:hypothetical protein
MSSVIRQPLISREYEGVTHARRPRSPSALDRARKSRGDRRLQYRFSPSTDRHSTSFFSSAADLRRLISLFWRRKESHRTRPLRAQAAEPGVRIHLAPPSSPSCFALFRESPEIRARVRAIRDCARTGEHLLRRYSPESSESYPCVILLGPSARPSGCINRFTGHGVYEHWYLEPEFRCSLACNVLFTIYNRALNMCGCRLRFTHSP